MKMIKYIAIGLTLFVLKSCGNSKEAVTTMKDNTQNMKKTGLPLGNYTVTLVDNENVPSNDLMISFDGQTNKVSGFSGCNRFFGTYTLEGNAISFKGLGSTERYCKRFMDVEQKMMTMLSEANTFSINNGELTLLKDSKSVLIAKAMENRTSKMQEDMSIEYTAGTRGFYKQVVVLNNMISVKNHHSEEPSKRACTPEEIDLLNKAISKLSIKRLSDLEPPSKAHQYDGAAMSYLKITTNTESYQTPSFDHGKPNAYIANLVKLLLKLADDE